MPVTTRNPGNVHKSTLNINDEHGFYKYVGNGPCLSGCLPKSITKNSVQRTFKEVNGLMFKQRICQLKYRPHRRSDGPKFICHAINQLIHIIEEV
jgi:hypothetical protein